MIILNNGSVVGFPLCALPGPERAMPEDLRRIEIEGGGYRLRVARLDADLSVPRRLEDQFGSTLVKRAVARAGAAKANGRLCGRPRKPEAA